MGMNNGGGAARAKVWMCQRDSETPRSGGTKVRTIEARVTYQNIGKMAWGSGPGVITGMVPECSWSVQRWSGVSGVRVEIHGYDTYPLPCISDLLNAPSHAKVYTKLNLQHAYHLVRI